MKFTLWTLPFFDCNILWTTLLGKGCDFSFLQKRLFVFRFGIPNGAVNYKNKRKFIQFVHVSHLIWSPMNFPTALRNWECVKIYFSLKNVFHNLTHDTNRIFMVATMWIQSNDISTRCLFRKKINNRRSIK